MDSVMSEINEQVAERLFTKYDTLGEKRWQRDSGYSTDNWRVAWIEDAAELGALITEANDTEWEAKLARVRELHPETLVDTGVRSDIGQSEIYWVCPYCQERYPCQTIETLGEVQE